MEPLDNNTQLISRPTSTVAYFIVEIVLYIPSFALLIITKGLGLGIIIMNVYPNQTYDIRAFLAPAVTLAIVFIIPFLITEWMFKSYRMRKTTEFIISIIIALAWVGGWMFYGWNYYITTPVHTEPPVCKDGYGYTISTGPTDAGVYSRCRKGPIIDNSWGATVPQITI